MEATERTQLTRRSLGCGLIAAAGLAPKAFAAPQDSPLIDWLEGQPQQSGYMVGHTLPGTVIFLNGKPVQTTDAHGWFVIGFDRDATETQVLHAENGRLMQTLVMSITARSFTEQRIDGLPTETVTPTAPDVLERIRRESARKQLALANRAPFSAFAQPFTPPLASYVVSSPYGVRRILNGEPRTPHYGIDLAAPTGTPVLAPQSAQVVMADPTLHFEGGFIMLDHGQGLITMYLHLSDVSVRFGQTVRQGDRIGNVGATGRATGPHLCWRMKWRDQNMDPSLWLLPRKRL